MTYLPGIPPEDQDRPASPAEIKRADREFKALAVWTDTGSLGEVKRRLNLRSEKEASVYVNRGRRRYFQEHTADLDARRGGQLKRLDDLREHLRQLVISGDKHALLQAVDRLIKLDERESRLLGLDAEKDDGGGVNMTIITSLPWERPGGEVVDAPEVEEGDEGADELPPADDPG